MAGLRCCASHGGIISIQGLAANSGSPWILQATNLHFSDAIVNALKPINQVLIALQFYANGGLLQVVGNTTGEDKSTVSLVVHNMGAILETITVLTHGKLHYRILIVD